MKVEVVRIDLEEEQKIVFEEKLGKKIGNKGERVLVSWTFREPSFILRFIKIS